MEFDYVVVGGGSAGCVLAGRLTEDPALTVCVLEAGGVDNSMLIKVPAGLAGLAKTGQANWQFQTVAQPGLNGRSGYQPRGKVLGGSSSVNAMVYIRGQREDYDAWAAEGNAGWSYDDMLPYFKRSEHNERGADDYHGVDGPLNVMDLRSPSTLAPEFVKAGQQAGFPANADFNGAQQEGVGMYQVTHKNGERWNAACAYLTPHLGRANLTVLTGARAMRVLFEGKRAVGVEVRHGGVVKQIRARREVLLSGGALMSPQLLMLSGVGPKAHLAELGIPLLHELPGVGANLHDHVDVVAVVDAPRLKDTFGISLAGGLKLLSAIFDWRRHRRGMLTSNIAEAGGFIKSGPDAATPDLQLHFVVGKLVDHGRKTVLGHGYSCHVCLLRPKSRGSLRLASKDPFAAPLIDPNFLGERDDVERLRRGVREMRKILHAPALAAQGGREVSVFANAQSDEQIDAFVRAYADTIYHPVGTCRMGSGPMDVVDAQLRVHGMSGLRVVDASMMPQIISGNTNGPVMAIAEKAVDLIRAGV